MVSLVKSSFVVIIASIFNSFVVCKEEQFLSRKRRYLTFPEESTLQLVYDQIIGVVDYTNLFILGITCAMAWQLPHEPFDEDFLRKQFLNDEESKEPKRRIDENITDTSVNDYVVRNSNSLDSSSWNGVLRNFSYSTSWDDSTRKKFAYQKWRKPTKKHLVYAAIGKRSIPPTSGFDRFYINHHRTTRHVIYKKIEKFLNARGVHGSDCLRKALCETSQRKNDEKPGSFVAEIMRVIFSLPVPNEDTVYRSLTERDYDMAHSASVNCTEIYSKCKESLWDLDFI